MTHYVNPPKSQVQKSKLKRIVGVYELLKMLATTVHRLMSFIPRDEILCPRMKFLLCI
jgi:hypothetical protein